MTLTISICIPCLASHINLLDRCIKSIYKQILHPDEVIISISSVEDMEATKTNVENQIGKYQDRLKIIILYTEEKKYAGENRNIAIAHATGDIITFIDADDAMYSNRLWVLFRTFSQTPSCLGVLHHFTENEEIREESWKFDVNNIKDYLYTDKLHFGHPTFRREIFDSFSYSNKPRGQDFELLEAIVQKLRSQLKVYNKKLSHYNSNDSTFSY
jgi:glycosyltransferase involved in cell wall biosynthesis